MDDSMKIPILSQLVHLDLCVDDLCVNDLGGIVAPAARFSDFTLPFNEP